MPGEIKALRDGIDMDVPWGLVTDYATMPREDPDEANAAAEHLVGKLRALGLPVETHAPDLFLSLPRHAEVRFGEHVLAAKVPAFSRCVPEGVTAPLLHVPAGRVPQGVAGRIVVTEGMALPNVVAGLEMAGAAGVVAINPGARIHWGTVSTIWGTPGLEDLHRLPGIPSAAVNRADGDTLVAAAQAGQTATLATVTKQGWFRSLLPHVRIPGRNPDRFVLLHGHYDSWQVGVGDNGTGNACMLEVARLLWQRRGSLEAGVWLAWWPGHSTGRYGGSAWFADTFASDLDAGCIVQMNCDSPGCRWATSYESITMMPETVAAVQGVVREVTGQHAAPKRAARNSDWSFNNLGISGAFMASSMIPEAEAARHGQSYSVGGCGGNVAWHTEDDTLAIADPDVLRTDVALYAAAVLAFAAAPRPPLDFPATLRDHAATLGQYQHACGTLFDLGPARQALEALAAKLAQAEPDTATLLRLARVLVPLDLVRGPRFQHDPALNTPPLPAVSAATEIAGLPAHQQGFARASLLRGRNHLVDAYRRAAALL